MTMRLSTSILAGTARTLVAVGTVSDAFMFFTTLAAAPRSTLVRGPEAPSSAAVFAVAVLAAGFGAAGLVAGRWSAVFSRPGPRPGRWPGAPVPGWPGAAARRRGAAPVVAGRVADASASAGAGFEAAGACPDAAGAGSTLAARAPAGSAAAPSSPPGL